MGWLEGTFDSRSLFQGEMNITIFDDSDESREYAEKCIEHYNNLNTNQKVLDEIQQKLSAFMFYMYDEWKAMEIYDDIVTDTEKAVVRNCYSLDGRSLPSARRGLMLIRMSDGTVRKTMNNSYHY